MSSQLEWPAEEQSHVTCSCTSGQELKCVRLMMSALDAWELVGCLETCMAR